VQAFVEKALDNMAKAHPHLSRQELASMKPLRPAKMHSNGRKMNTHVLLGVEFVKGE